MDPHGLFHRSFIPFLPSLRVSGQAETCSSSCHNVIAPKTTRPDQWVEGGPRFNLSPGSANFTSGPPKPAKPAYNPAKDPFESTHRRINVLQYTSAGLDYHVVLERPDQRFADYATPWEMRWSGIIQHGMYKFLPIVDDKWTVVGYYGIVSGKELICTHHYVGWDDLGAALKNDDDMVFVQADDNQRLPEGWERLSDSDTTYEVITSIDGEVTNGGIYRARGAESEEPTIVQLILLEVGTRIITKVAGLVLRSIMRRVRAGGGRLLEGVTKALAKRAEKKQARVTFKRLMGYDKKMGIPMSHFKPMVEACKATNSIAVFRANKGAAIPLIERGATPKPKALSIARFKTSTRTGVLTATEPAHLAAAYDNGFYVIEADGVARRYSGGKVIGEFKPKNPFWTIEKDQVLDANGMPVVGDYDLAGVMPLESPGSNVVGVPANTKKGDWIGPHVERYKDAVNSRLDQPRVFAGQDGFHDPQYGGLTDDVAYAVFPDGTSIILDGKAAQEEFYAAYGRQTAIGRYPRPSSGTAVFDETAAMCAQKRREVNYGKGQLNGTGPIIIGPVPFPFSCLSFNCPSAFRTLSCQFLDLLSVRQQPCLEVVECHVRMEAILLSDPGSHFAFGIVRRRKLWRDRACVDIGKCDDSIGRILAVMQKVLNDSLQFAAHRDPPVVR